MIRILLLFALMVNSSLARNQLQQPEPQAPIKQWLTLSGGPPLVIARGGFSGLFPESSIYANDIVKQLNHTKMALSCNLQLTKDGIGICLSDIRLDSCTNIGTVFPDDSNTYNVNGQQIKGWFAVDFTSDWCKAYRLGQMRSMVDCRYLLSRMLPELNLPCFG
ncbi:hypothetical protein V6N13_107450 [Hibiscus sabdariffa]|uniref:glycerophosphodiester phosphodiesterase n=1 Tax=Hibiscus sabdariffa TaxID=183260 RepID=A0ABR2SP81_9ROSI